MAMKRLISFWKRLKEILKGPETDPYNKMGLGIAIANGILAYLGHGDLGGNLDFSHFYADDPRIIDFLSSDEALSILAAQLEKERIPERKRLADGIRRGGIMVSPLSEAPENRECVSQIYGLPATVLFELSTQRSDSDCKITIEGMEPFLLSEKEAICGQYLFGRESQRPQRENSFVLPASWTKASRAQGAIYKEHGNWYVIQQNSHTCMKVNGETLDSDETEELTEKGRIDIEGYRIMYEIVEL